MIFYSGINLNKIFNRLMIKAVRYLIQYPITGNTLKSSFPKLKTLEKMNHYLSLSLNIFLNFSILGVITNEQ